MLHPVSMLKNATDLASVIASLFAKKKDAGPNSHAKVRGVRKRKSGSTITTSSSRIRLSGLWSFSSADMCSTNTTTVSGTMTSATTPSTENDTSDVYENSALDSVECSCSDVRSIGDTVDVKTLCDHEPDHRSLVVSDQKLKLPKSISSTSMSSNSNSSANLSFSCELLESILKDSCIDDASD
ncbi:hypothetical protein GCK32_016145 [Trichostrongylus colubriformis]|uniref:Uncharacterized protein n=1 Tax=Trichostrongylus colubriformis TaxID=6319 RepID=A0AAN8IDW1_TRICO